MNKVIEISLIENAGKKKKSRDNTVTLTEYKKKIINDLEDVISFKFFENKNPEQIKQSGDFIDVRNKFVTFYNSYIELNKLFMAKNFENNMIKEILDELVTNVIYRFENLNFSENKIKEVELLKEIIEKDKERLEVDMEN
tara:strand:- start:893 stop:1312 length:420 start_codon:yes stop_codon:yes gene_type:complete